MNARQRRLLKEYEELTKLKNQSDGVFNFTNDFSYTVYKATLNGVKTLVGCDASYSLATVHNFSITLPPEFPKIQPSVKFDTPIFHPNWYKDGRVCYGTKWQINNTLSELVIDTVKMMMFILVRPDSSANNDAKEWYNKNKTKISSLVPIFQFPLPLGESQIEFLSNEHSNDNEEIEFVDADNKMIIL